MSDHTRPADCPCGGRVVPETNRGVEHLICTSCHDCSVCGPTPRGSDE
jgi:hypothetical protein